jgi:hypothetical protein
MYRKAFLKLTPPWRRQKSIMHAYDVSLSEDMMYKYRKRFYIVLLDDRVAGLYTSPVDAAIRCSQPPHALACSVDIGHTAP